MIKAGPMLVLAGFACPGMAGAADDPKPLATAIAEAAQDVDNCKSNEEEVVVCGRSRQRFRIDPAVLAATRAAEAPPPKPSLDASRDTSCTGANCGGATIPLVAIALTVLKAAELAAKGDDWREAFRTRPDAYKQYQDAKAKEAARSEVTVGLAARNK